MPSGYTSDLYEGKNISFTQFALQCARAFGAAIDQRDDACATGATVTTKVVGIVRPTRTRPPARRAACPTDGDCWSVGWVTHCHDCGK